MKSFEIAAPAGTCARCAVTAGVASTARSRDGKTFLVLAEGAGEAAVRERLADVATCEHAAADARRIRLRAAGLDERTAALALVLAQGEKAPDDARALVADLAERAAKAWGS